MASREDNIAPGRKPVCAATRRRVGSRGQSAIISCDAWGARQPKAPNQVLDARPTFIVIHHTATPNTSNLEQSHAMGLARSIQLDHMNRGYGDTGQHFTVSRGGWILEGRRGSLAALLSGTSQVVGAHAPGRNTDGIGIENEGTYIKEKPPFALQYSLLLLCAFICRQYGLGSNSIIGHRNINATQCPGEKFYKDLDNLRTAVAVMI